MANQAGGQFSVNSPITWAQLGAIFAIVIAIVGPLTAALYAGIRDGQKETNDRLKSLEDHFQTAIAADVEIKDLLKNAPHLMLDITDIKENSKQIREDVVMLHEGHKQLASLPQQFEAMQIQPNNIQKQIHTIPGVK